MKNLISKISIAILILYALFMPLILKYLILYFILLNLTLMSIYVFSNKKNIFKIFKYNILFFSNIFLGFGSIIISFYLNFRWMLFLPIIEQIFLIFFVKERNSNDIIEKVNSDESCIEVSIDENFVFFENYMRNIDTRISWCSEEIYYIYKNNNNNDFELRKILSELEIEIKDSKIQKKNIYNAICRISNKKILEDREYLMTEIQELYTRVENIRIGIEYLKVKIYNKEEYSIEENKGYLEIINTLENKIDTILQELKNNDLNNKKGFESIKKDLNGVSDRIKNLTDNFSKDIDRIVFDLKNTPESILKAMIEFNKNINNNFSSIFKNIDFTINSLKNEVDNNLQGFYKELLDKSIAQKKLIEDEREKYIEIFIEKINEIKIDEDVRLNEYNNKLSYDGLLLLKNAERIYEIVRSKDDKLDDYSPAYIMYTKFLEIEISNKLHLQNSKNSLGTLVKKLEKNIKCTKFVNEFNRLNIRERRNLAAHGGKIKITINDLNCIREFLFSSNGLKILCD